MGRIDDPLLNACLVIFRILPSLNGNSTAIYLRMTEPAQVENPEPPPTKRQCYFHFFWFQTFQGIGCVNIFSCVIYRCTLYIV